MHKAMTLMVMQSLNDIKKLTPVSEEVITKKAVHLDWRKPDKSKLDP
jgi:hypothetical protein